MPRVGKPSEAIFGARSNMRSARDIAFVFITPWWWVLAMTTLIFVLINLIQGELNLELGARVLAVNRKTKFD